MTAEIFIVEERAGFVEVRDAEGELLTVLEPSADIVQIVTPELAGPPGPQGAQGTQGAQGVQGLIGPQGPFVPTYVQSFASPSLLWLVNHNLDAYPTVDIYDLYGNAISGDVLMPDRNTVVVTFDVAVAGTVIIKA